MPAFCPLDAAIWTSMYHFPDSDFNSGFCEAIGMTPFKAMLEIEAFEAWGDLEIHAMEDKPHDLAKPLSHMHKVFSEL